MKVRYRIECDDYRTPRAHETREDAERALAAIERCGACTLEHRIVPVDGNGAPLRVAS